MKATTFTSRARAAATVSLAAMILAVPTAHAAEPSRACLVAADNTMECFPNERALDAAHPELNAKEAPGASPSAACSSSVRLYTATNYGGSVYVYTARQQVINLQSGIDNQTSSYKIGACGATFYENASLGGAMYPGSTSANASSTSMNSGWDNRVSSIWIA